MEKRLWLLYCDIIDKAYKNKVSPGTIKRYKYIYITISNKESKSYHGLYYGGQNKIKIVNTSRNDISCLKTSIHELAHHIDYINRGSTDHSDSFYKAYKDLIKAALEIGLFKKEDILSMQRDSTDHIKLLKIVNELDVDVTEVYKENIKLVQVKNCFIIKDYLKSINFKWNSSSLLWEKEVNVDELNNLLSTLYKIIEKENVLISSANNFHFENKRSILVKNSYDYSLFLKERGYRFNNKPKGFIKEINTTEVDKEISFLNKIGLSSIKILTK